MPWQFRWKHDENISFSIFNFSRPKFYLVFYTVTNFYGLLRVSMIIRFFEHTQPILVS